MCSGKEQLKRNLHRSSKGAPKRKEKMKKTIAILLVLVIGMVGVWAATGDDVTVKITTEVPYFSVIRLTDNTNPPIIADTFLSQSAFTGNSNFKENIVYDTEDYATLDAFSSEKTIAYIYGLSNNTSPIGLTLTTAGFESTDATDTTVIDLKINDGATENTASFTIGAAANGVLGKLNSSNGIKIVEFYQGSIAQAPALDYEATLTITIGAP